MKREKKKQRKEENYLIRKALEHLKKKKNYKYLEILEVDTIKQTEMKEIVWKLIRHFQWDLWNGQKMQRKLKATVCN